jgi:hypothetical protein
MEEVRFLETSVIKYKRHAFFKVLWQIVPLSDSIILQESPTKYTKRYS